MKEISLKREPQKLSKLETAPPDQPSYPSFSVYDKAPDELLKCPIGEELTAKIKLTSKDIHEGTSGRKSVGFDVISVLTKENIDDARIKGKEIADKYLKKTGGDKNG